MSSRTSYILRTLAYAVTFAALTAAVLQTWAAAPTTRTLMLGAGAAVLLYAGIDIRVTTQRRRASSLTRSMHAATAMLMILVVGPWITALATLVASLARDARVRCGLQRSLDNLTNRCLPIVAGGSVFSVMHGASAPLELPADYLALGATMLVFALVQELGYVIDARMKRRRGAAPTPLREQLAHAATQLIPTMQQVFVGGGIGVVCLVSPWAVPLVVPIAVSAYIALERGGRIQEVTERALDTFARIVDERDTYTFEHSHRVCEYSVQIAEELGMSERDVETLYWCARLHDLGKVAVDNSILNKPGKLSDDEFEVMRQHPETSARILASFAFDERETEIVRCHHERFDGRGYFKRAADTVPPEAFIIAVADSYDAMTSDRPYRSALPIEVALREIQLGIGTQFAPEPARAFLRTMGHVWVENEDTARAGMPPAPAIAPPAGSLLARGAIELGDDLREAA